MDEIRQPAGVVVTGKVCAGLGEGRFFTALPWFRSQLAQKLGIDPYPGTLNLNLETVEDRQRLADLRRSAGVEIVPEGDSCPGLCYRVLFDGEIRGAAVFPGVGGYPEDKLELVAGVNLKQTLGIKDGDVISVVIEA